MSAVNLAVRCLILTLIVSIVCTAVFAEPQNEDALRISIGTGKEAEGGEGLSLPLRIVLLLTLLTFLPAILISMTSFTRIIVVAHFLRQALGTQQSPNNQILLGLALFLTLFVMGPVWDEIYRTAVVPYQEGRLDELEAVGRAQEPLREFMLKQVREEDLALFVRLGKLPRPKSSQDLPTRVIVPAFMISELKTAFQIGFVLFLPFLVIDMVVSSVLLSMGMLQLPPMMISMPFKVLLFILVDGWRLIVGSLIESFRF
ncbi:MAG: flagellar type III secretion system pore protein FliP [Acidobacteriota bacterium]